MSEVPGRKYKQVERQQLSWGVLDLEKLVPADDPARVVWELTGKLDLSGFDAHVKTVEGEAGSPAWPPRLLLAVWLYGYQQGICSANKLSQMMDWHPGLMVLTGRQVINVHTLCDFRTQYREELDALLQQLMVLLSREGLVDLSTVAHDGTKIQSRAGQGSARSRTRIQEDLQRAQAYMEQLDAQALQPGVDAKQAAARERAARERVERMQRALQEFESGSSGKIAPERISTTEPEARKMRHTQNGGWHYSYNAQISTEACHRIIVGVSLTQDQNDLQQLEPAVETVERCTGHIPERILADGGYVTRHNIDAMAERGIELIAPVKDAAQQQAAPRARHGVAPAFDRSRFTREGENWRCPAGQLLVQIGQKKHHGQMTQTFAADAVLCAPCPHKPRCCPQTPARQIHWIVESAAVRAHQERMETEWARRLYRLRSRIAEFPHMRIKSNWGFRRFSVRGLAKATSELLLVVLAYNFSRWQWANKQRTRAATC